MIHISKFRIQVNRSSSDLVLAAHLATSKQLVQKRSAYFFARHYTVSESVHISIKEGPIKWPAKYNNKELRSNTFNVLTDIIKMSVKMYSVRSLYNGG